MKALLTFILIALHFKVSCRKLVFLECITRHGVRYPSYPNEFDYSNITLLDNAKSQLTFQGRRMHFILGRLLYKKYWSKLFPESNIKREFNHSWIYAKSTNTNRTIQSLQNLLVGLFSQLNQSQGIYSKKAQINPPFEESIEGVEDEFYQYWKRQKIVPIHVQKGAEGDPGLVNALNQGDFLVKQQYNLCPNQRKWQIENIRSPFTQNIMDSTNIKNSLERLKLIYGQLPLDFNNVYKYIDNYLCLKAMGKPYLPIFQDPSMKEYLEFLYIARLYIVYLSTDIQIKTFSKTLITTTIDNMKKAIDGKGPRMVFYSGHDITIAILLSAFNLTNINCIYQRFMLNNTIQNCYWEYPHFASSFIFQLWQQDTFQYTIEVSINGKSYKLPFCGQLQNCQLQRFEDWFNQFTIKTSPNEQCGVSIVRASTIYIQISIAFCLGAGIPIILYLCFHKRKNERVIDKGSRLESDQLE